MLCGRFRGSAKLIVKFRKSKNIKNLFYFTSETNLKIKIRIYSFV